MMAGVSETQLIEKHVWGTYKYKVWHLAVQDLQDLQHANADFCKPDLERPDWAQ